MSEKETTTTKEQTRGKFSIIDMLMIIMVVGVILTIIIPLQQSRKNEAMVQQSILQVKRILEARETFKENNDWGEYPWTLAELTGTRIVDGDSLPPYIADLDTIYFTFSLTDTTVVATSTKLGRTEKSYFYDFRDRRFRVSEDSKDAIIDAWLP